MSYLILGIAVLAGLLLIGKWFVSAEPKTLARITKWVLIGLAVAVALFFVLTGKFFYALWALPFIVPILMRARSAARMARNFSRMSGGGASGMASEVNSDYLEMRLDHDSGEMDGTVRKGMFEGETLSRLTLEDLIRLYDEYSRVDGESARLLAAFLDRTHPEWRARASDDGRAGDPGADDTFEQTHGKMSRSEAFRILGLNEDAGQAEIKAAHHRLIAGLHPDRGGSAYLAAKINEARDVLLKS